MAEHRITEATLYVVENTYELRNGKFKNVADSLGPKQPSGDDEITCECGDSFDTLDDAEEHLREVGDDEEE